jgi:hypothetical protein
MKYTRLLIHYFQTFIPTSNIKLLNSRYTLICWTAVLNYTVIFNSIHLKYLLLGLNYSLYSDDVRILLRENRTLLAVFLIVTGNLSSEAIRTRKKLINIIKSPFATSSSKEHSSFSSYSLKTKLNGFNDILIIAYLSKINNHIASYNDNNVKVTIR